MKSLFFPLKLYFANAYPAKVHKKIVRIVTAIAIVIITTRRATIAIRGLHPNLRRQRLPRDCTVFSQGGIIVLKAIQ